MDPTALGSDRATGRLFEHTPIVGDRFACARFNRRFPPPDRFSVSPAGIQRNVQLASVLEPLVESSGKTTRSRDCSYEQRFAYFLAAGVSSGEAFRALGERLALAKARACQPVVYDLAFQAQVDSKRQRDGGRVNEGIIAMLFPLIIAQVLYLDAVPHPGNLGEAFHCVETAMRNTHPDDVRALCAMAELAWGMSGFPVSPIRVDAATVYDYYRLRQSRAAGPVFGQFLNNYTIAQRIVAQTLLPQGPIPRGAGLPEVVAAACRRVRATLPASYSPAQLADDTAVALYMLFSHHPRVEVLF